MNFSLSFWEKTSFFEEVDVCIIGSGLVGLHAAIAITQQRPGTRVLMLERGFLPYGASTRNAGFACFGSLTELIDDLSRESEQAVFDRVQMRWEGLTRLRELLGDQDLDYQELGGYELFREDENQVYQACMDRIGYFNEKIRQITGISEAYSQSDNQIGRFGFNGVSHLVLNSAEGQLDTGKMMMALEAKAREAGVRILNGITVTHIEPGNSPVIHTDKHFDIRPGKVLVTTNAFARNLLPELQVEPARAQVLITKPIPDLKIHGAFHYDKGYYYFRNVNDRVLFGGGRNLDFETETTETFGLTTTVQQRLESLLQTVILPGIPHQVDMRWSGIMGMGPTREPIIRETGKNCYCAVRMGGMGVAIGSMAGQKAAALMLG